MRWEATMITRVIHINNVDNIMIINVTNYPVLQTDNTQWIFNISSRRLHRLSSAANRGCASKRRDLKLIIDAEIVRRVHHHGQQGVVPYSGRVQLEKKHGKYIRQVETKGAGCLSVTRRWRTKRGTKVRNCRISVFYIKMIVFKRSIKCTYSLTNTDHHWGNVLTWIQRLECSCVAKKIFDRDYLDTSKWKNRRLSGLWYPDTKKRWRSFCFYLSYLNIC